MARLGGNVNKSNGSLSGLAFLSDVSPQTLRTIVATGSDIALLVTDKGIVTGVHLARDLKPANDVETWSGAELSSLVTEESIPKIAEMLDSARSDDEPRWREINHRTSTDEDFPVRYAAVKSGSEGNVILLGRDLRMAAQLQKRLMQAQLTMEQDYERIRQIETRYRVLFETTHEALVIVSSDTGRIVDANTASARLFARDVSDLANSVFSDRFAAAGRADLAVALAMVRETGRERTVTLRNAADGARLNLDVILFRSVNDTLYLCRLTPANIQSVVNRGFDQSLTALYSRSVDAMVFTDQNGAILRANTAFMSMADVAVAETLTEMNLGEFLARPEIDLNVLMSNAKVKGRLSVYATRFRSAFGVTVPVEISTTYLPEAEPEVFGFILRDVTRSAPSRETTPLGAPVSSDAVEQIIAMVGTTPLKDLVRGTTDVVEKLCIETAIKLTNNNRASAAEMLGLSRQSLYVKLRKYGLIGQDDDQA